MITLRNLTVVLVATLTFISPASLMADFYVIPVIKKMKNIVTVSKSGGEFTDIKQAINSITDANETNPYLVIVGPGVYNITETIHLKAYVTLSGSGRDSTILKGFDLMKMIYGENNATLSHMHIENVGGENSSELFCIYNSNTSPTLEDLTVISKHSGHPFAIVNTNSSSPIIKNVTAIGLNTGTGIFNDATSFPFITNSILNGDGNDIVRGKVFFSSIVNTNASGTECHYCIDGLGNELNASCVP